MIHWLITPIFWTFCVQREKEREMRSYMQMRWARLSAWPNAKLCIRLGLCEPLAHRMGGKGQCPSWIRQNHMCLWHTACIAHCSYSNRVAQCYQCDVGILCYTQQRMTDVDLRTSYVVHCVSDTNCHNSEDVRHSRRRLMSMLTRSLPAFGRPHFTAIEQCSIMTHSSA